MKKFNVVAASAVALTAALAGGNAFAHGTFANTTATYNAASVAADNGLVTVPWGTSATAVYTVSQGSLEVNSRFTVTLPTGFAFSGVPLLTANSVGTTFSAPVAGGIGNQSVSFTIVGAPVGTGGTISVGQAAVQTPLTGPGAITVVNTAGTGDAITVQATNNVLITNDDINPVPASGVGTSGPAFASNSGATSSFMNGNNNFIDLTSPSLGTLFNVNDTMSNDAFVDVSTIDIGTLSISTAPNTLSANGVSIESLNTADTVTVTINGAFTGISAATAVTTGGGPEGNCGVAGVAGDVLATGTVTGTTITIPGVPVGSADICITSAGTTLLTQNGSVNPQVGFTANFTPAAKVADFLAGSATDQFNAIQFIGGQVLNATNFFTGSDAGYTSLLRVSNGGTTPANLFALVQPYSGGPQLTGSLGPALGAGTGTVFTLANLVTAIPGLSLANSGQRATVQVIATGTGGVTASGLLVNPGGVVDNVN